MSIPETRLVPYYNPPKTTDQFVREIREKTISPKEKLLEKIATIFRRAQLCLLGLSMIPRSTFDEAHQTFNINKEINIPTGMGKTSALNAYWDQPHTSGSDFIQLSQISALMLTPTPQHPYSDFVQPRLRMRMRIRESFNQNERALINKLRLPIPQGVTREQAQQKALLMINIKRL